MRFALLLLIGMFQSFTLNAQAIEPTAIVQERIELMKEMSQQVKTIADMVRKRAPLDPEKMKRAADKIAKDSLEMIEMFPEGSLTDDSKATASVWTKRNKFELYATDLQEEANRVAAGAEYANLKLSKRQFRNMGRICAGCHKHFRKPDSRADTLVE